MTWLVWSLLSAIFAAATALLAKLGVSNVDPNLATAIRTTVVVIFTWTIAPSLGSHQVCYLNPGKSLHKAYSSVLSLA